jgi:ParB family chromosome partitioning protein
MLEMALVENIQREELDSIEIALAYQRLIEEVKLTQEEVSEKVAKKRSTITNYLRLLRLPPEIQLGIRTRKLSMGHARALINIEDPQQQLNLYNQIVSNELSVRQVEEAARAVKSPEKKSIERSTFKVSAELKSAINQINKKINTPLEVKVGKDGTGLLNIKFQSNEELEDLLKKLTH